MYRGLIQLAITVGSSAKRIWSHAYGEVVAMRNARAGDSDPVDGPRFRYGQNDQSDDEPTQPGVAGSGQRKPTKMDIVEAKRILNTESQDVAELTAVSERIFFQNAPENGGSKFLQGKVVGARIAIEEEYKIELPDIPREKRASK